MKKEKLGQAILYFLLANLILLVCVLRINRGAALVDIGSSTPGASMSLYYAADSTFDENRRTDTRPLGAAGTQVYTLNPVGGVVTAPICDWTLRTRRQSTHSPPSPIPPAHFCTGR